MVWVKYTYTFESINDGKMHQGGMESIGISQNYINANTNTAAGIGQKTYLNFESVETSPNSSNSYHYNNNYVFGEVGYVMDADSLPHIDLTVGVMSQILTDVIDDPNFVPPTSGSMTFAIESKVDYVYNDGVVRQPFERTFTSTHASYQWVQDGYYSGAIFSVVGSSGQEGGSATITISRSGDTSTAQSVHYETVEGNAKAGSDYGSVSGTLNFAAGEAAKQVSVSLLDDAVFEGAESFGVLLSGATNGAVASTVGKAAVIDITDTDTAPTYAISPASASIGEGGSTAFVVTRSTATDSVSTLAVSTSAGSDAVLDRTYVTFAAGALQSNTVTLTAVQDTEVEPVETVTVSVAGATASVKIYDDDIVPPPTTPPVANPPSPPTPPPVYTLSLVGAGIATEGDGSEAVLKVERTVGGTAGQVTLDLDFIQNTALNADVVARPSWQVTIPERGSSALVYVSAFDDLLVEGTESGTFVLKPVSGATVSGSAQITIRDNDTPALPPPTYTFPLSPFTSGPDSYIGTGANELLDGLAGNDTIDGEGGNDLIYGRAGNDTLKGGTGADKLYGGDDNDILDGVMGADLLDGGAGNDTFYVDSLDDQVIEAAGGGTDRVYATVSYTLGIGQEIEQLFAGNSAPLTLTGNGVANLLAGNGVNNTLDGGGGADQLIGYGGDDTYLIDDSGDRVTEAAGGGVDRVIASVSYGLAAGQDIERLELAGFTGTAALNLTGNEVANTLVGNAGANVLDGRGGADILTGLGGNDTYVIDNAADQVIEAAGGGIDRVNAGVSYALVTGQEVEQLWAAVTGAINLTGNEIANLLAGNGAANTLDGGGGADQMVGYGGDDIYYVDNAGDRVVEAVVGGTDKVIASVSFAIGSGQEIERAELSPASGTAALNLTGNEMANALTGNAGSNVLDGRGGADVMTGLAGSDIYYVDNAADQVIEAAGGGTDRVNAGVSYALATGQEVEQLWATGAGAINLTGNGIANLLAGNNAANTLDGGGGADQMVGYAGDDIYYVDNSGDRVTETAGGGSDRVFASVSYVIGTGQEIERVELSPATGTGSLNLTGNDIANGLTGNAGSNVLDGRGGADTLTGLDGNDIYYVDNTSDQVVEAAGGGTDRVNAAVSYGLAAGQEIEVLAATGSAAIDLTGNAGANYLYGNNAANLLTGGVGNDTLTGAGGADIFAFSSGFGRDWISDFTTIKAAGAAHDTVRVDSGLFANDDPLAAARDVGTSVVLTATTGDQLILANTRKADLSMADFAVASLA